MQNERVQIPYLSCVRSGMEVSVNAENIKKYICPVCRNKERKKTRNIGNDMRKDNDNA